MYSNDAVSNFEQLTERQRDVVRLVGSGQTNREVAKKLGISVETVKSHLSVIFNCIGIDNRTELSVWLDADGGSYREEIARLHLRIAELECTLGLATKRIIILTGDPCERER